jgi:hypothetical protein
MFLMYIFVGVVCLFIGWMYFYKQNIILRINAFLRNRVFADIHVLTDHRKIGVLFILIALIFLYIGFTLKQR